MGKLLAVLTLVLLGVIALGFLGSELPDTNPLGVLASGIREVVSGIVDSISAAGRGVAGSFGS